MPHVKFIECRLYLITKLAALKKKILSDPAVKAEYMDLAIEFEIAQALTAGRLRAGFTQEEQAKKMETKQSTIA